MSAVALPADFDAYRHYSQLFKRAVASIAPCIEDRGIDEIYIDLTELDADTESLALCIKQAVREATGLSCSIGITPNKLLSKICSELDKPDGITLLSHADIPSRIWPLAARKINGIGPKAAAKLAAIGIHTVGELAHADAVLLHTHFGHSYVDWLHDASHGIDDRPVVTYAEPKSISRETTFEHDLHPRHDRPVLSEIFTSLCTKLSEDLARKGYVSRTIGIKLRFDDFRTVTRDFTLPSPIADPLAIRQAAGECLKRVKLEKKLRLLGVRASSLSKPVTQCADEESPQRKLFALP